MWYSAAKAKILASQHFANLHRIRFPLHSIFFQNNSFFMGSNGAGEDSGGLLGGGYRGFVLKILMRVQAKTE